jgi:Family of unknown function (DUF5703)
MQRRGATWEYREFSFPRGTSREMARVMLTGAAETENWEMDQLRLYPDGRRIVRLRRRVYRFMRTA